MKPSLDKPRSPEKQPVAPVVGEGAVRAADIRITRFSEVAETDTQVELESSKISIGDTITLEIYDDEAQISPTKTLTVLLVERPHTGENPDAVEVSIGSTIGRCIINKQKSDDKIPTPDGKKFVKILDIVPAG